MFDFSRSAAGRFLGALGAFPSALLRPLARGKARSAGGWFPHQWFLAVGAAGMFCVPHSAWNNVYGVLFAAAALALYWWDCAALERRARNPALLGGGVWIFLLMCLLCTLWAHFRAASLRVAIFYWTGFVLAYLAAVSFPRPEDLRRLAGLLYAALIVTAVYGLLVYFTGRETYGAVVGDAVYARLASTLEHGINYSEFAAMLLPVAVVWAARTPDRRRRWVLLFLLLLPLAALLLTYARTGWIAAGLSALVLLWVLDKRLLIPAAALGIAGFFLLPEGLQGRFLSMLQFNDTGSSGRFTLWRECFSMLRRHWLLGVGLGPENFYRAYLPHATGLLPFQPPHANMGYLEIFLSLGVAGFLAFVSFFFGVFPRLRRAAQRLPEKKDRWSVYALTASLAGGALANLPEHLWFYPRVLFLWCLLYGLALGLTGEIENTENIHRR